MAKGAIPPIKPLPYHVRQRRIKPIRRTRVRTILKFWCSPDWDKKKEK